MSMTLKFTWAGLLCGAILLGCYEFRRSALAASAPAAPGETSADGRLSVPGPDRIVISGIEEDQEISFPYAVIMERNPFRLNPPPLPPATPPPPAPDLPAVFLSGTRKEGDKTMVMFAVKYKKTAKDPETTTYMSLCEGEGQDPVELLSIAPSGDEVTILNSGTRQVLTMKDKGLGSKAAGASAPAQPGVISRPATAVGGVTSLPATMAMAGGVGSGGSGINVGSSAVGSSARHTGEMIVGGNTGSEPSRTPTTVASASVANNSGLITGGSFTTTTPTPPQPGPTPIPQPLGGTPKNFAADPSPIPPGTIMPPMPTLPTTIRR
jgi:hypothetical protein